MWKQSSLWQLTALIITALTTAAINNRYDDNASKGYLLWCAKSYIYASVFCTLLIFFRYFVVRSDWARMSVFCGSRLVKSFQHNLHLANEIRACSWSCVIREKLSERKESCYWKQWVCVSYKIRKIACYKHDYALPNCKYNYLQYDTKSLLLKFHFWETQFSKNDAWSTHMLTNTTQSY